MVYFYRAVGSVVQQGISEFGERQRFTELANLAAGIRSKEEQCLDSPDLFDVDRPMVRRARYARLRAGSRKWWSKQLQSATNANELWMSLSQQPIMEDPSSFLVDYDPPKIPYSPLISEEPV